MLVTRAGLLKIGFVLLALLTISSGARAKGYGCSWSGPAADWLLARTLPRAHLAGDIYDMVELLQENDIPISFIPRSGDQSPLGIEHSTPLTVQELIDLSMDQVPGYRLEVLGRKPIIYPSDEGYDTLIEIDEPHETTRASAMLSILKELREKRLGFLDLAPLAFKGPSGGIYGEIITVGGTRSIVEHFASLTADRPSLAFVLFNEADDRKSFNLAIVGLVKDVELELPAEVKVGTEFTATPVVKLAFGSSATLIGPRCGVEYSSGDESVVTIDSSGRGVAVGEGRANVHVTYEGHRRYATVRVVRNDREGGRL